MFKRLFATAAVFGMAALAPPVHAQTACGPRENVTAQLAKKYGEYHRAVGLQNAARMVELWTSDGGASWTLLVTGPDGSTCIAASGSNWLEYKLIVPSMDVPS
jgi:alkylation response protein AidB-like acyl-CoA dehydrogenase